MRTRMGWAALFLVGATITSVAHAAIFPPEALSSNVDEDYWTLWNAFLACVAAVIGCIICFFGFRFIRFVHFCVGFMVPAIGVYVALAVMTPLYMWVSIVIALMVGLAGGGLLLCFYGLGLFGVGFTAAMAVVVVVWGGFFGQLWQSESWFPFSLWLFVSVIGVPVGAVVVFVQKKAVIGATSILGAFLITCSFDFYLNDKFAIIARQMVYGEEVTLYPLWLAFVALTMWVLLAMLGGAVQYLVTSHGVVHDYSEGVHSEYKRLDMQMMRGDGIDVADYDDSDHDL